MHKMAWWQTVRSLLLVGRVIVFEKYTLSVALFWWIFIGVSVLIFYWLDYRVAVGIALLGLIFSGLFQGYMVNLKHLLLRNGDRIEYALPDQGEMMQQFKTARLLRQMHVEDVAKRSLFDAEHLGFYTRFYLIDTGRKNIVIPYEWIMGIELEE